MTDERMNHVKLSLDPKQSPEAIAYFESIKTSTDSISSYELASKLIECDKTRAMPRELFEFVVGLYKEAISAGSVLAMNDLGALYYDGKGCCQDFTKAVYYFEMAAKHGNTLALENLGYCYYYGRTGAPDYEKAFHCFAQGAFCGQLVSLYKIGDMYRNGYYVERNPEEACRIYARCIEQMTSDDEFAVAGPVYLRLGNAHLKGEGVAKSPLVALNCFHRAEHYLYVMVRGGEVMYMDSLQRAIDGQKKARTELAKELPSRRWP